ncbi:MAG TPA: alpha/beta hydrolase [Acidobacteria bacterium]|nr:alpha/beta hydrolase [Acidobacteriota bacterium]
MQCLIDGRSAYIGTGGREIDAACESVVFVHGVGQNHTIWVLPTRHFVRKGFNVLSVDLPGHGRSAGPCLSSIEKMAAWVVEVLNATGLARAALVGHSMGSLVALAVAAQHPDRVRSLAMVATAVPMPVSDALLETSAANDHTALDMLTLWGHSSTAHLGGNPTPGLWMLGCGLRLMEESGPDVVHTDLSACNQYTKGLEHATQVACPTLLVLGERDALTPVRATRALADEIPTVATVVLPGAGHALLSERPDPVLDALIRIV